MLLSGGIRHLMVGFGTCWWNSALGNKIMALGHGIFWDLAPDGEFRHLVMDSALGHKIPISNSWSGSGALQSAL